MTAAVPDFPEVQRDFAWGPFFSYFGGKWKIADSYPKPRHGMIVEPFAGAAGYSTMYHDRQVVLVDKNPRIAGLWDYLIWSPAEEIQRIPLLRLDETVDDLGSVPQEARDLVGFWINRGSSMPKRSAGQYQKHSGTDSGYLFGWTLRNRIARQCERIKHWRAYCGEYWDAASHVLGRHATWFIDPPYTNYGHHYKYGSDLIDYRSLAAWCGGRFPPPTQVIVCEAMGARWLDFQPLIPNLGEAVWCR